MLKKINKYIQHVLKCSQVEGGGGGGKCFERWANYNERSTAGKSEIFA